MTELECDVLVVGGINSDYFGRGDTLPRSGETIGGDEFLESAGGKGANQAVAAARLGARVSLVGAVGNDERGRELVAHLRHAGVAVSGISVVEEVTGAALIHVARSGAK